MALLSGFEPLDANTDTVSTLVTKVNVIIDEMRDNVVTANNSLANTNGNSRVNGLFISNTSYVVDGYAIANSFVVETVEGNTDFIVSDNTAITIGATVLAGQAFPINTEVTDIDGTTVTVSNPALKSSQYIGTIDESSSNDAIQLSRFGLSGGISGNTDTDIDTANLQIVSNTSFTNSCDYVDIQNDLAVVGNVVIGADTDNVAFFSQKLVVNGAILTTNTSEEGGNVYFGNTDNSIVTVANGNMEIKTTSTLEIVTGTEERIRVDAVSGNVSIGGTQDSHHTVQVHANTDSPAIHITTDTTGKAADDGSLIAVSNTDSSLLISNRENSHIEIDTNDIERVRVSANGFVGINQTAPNEWLEVDGNIHVSGGDRTIFNRDENYLAFGTNNTEHARIVANGFIGINQTAPNEWLEVDGNIHVSGGDRTIYNRSNNYLALGTNNTERARIADNGNVSIATTETDHQLTVNGDILFTNATFGTTLYLGNTDNSLVKTPGGNTSLITTHNFRLFTDTKERVRVTDGGDVIFYSADGLDQKLYWDATNLVLGVNTADPHDNVALDVVGNTHTTDLNVAHQTTSGNVVVNDELRGNNTLTITTNTEFTALADQVLIRNDLFVEGDAQVTSNLTVNTDSTFVGNIEVQTDSLFIGNVEAQSTIEFTKGSSTLEFAGANQTFIWDATNTQSTIRTNANGSLTIDADKTNNGANTSRLDLRVDNKNSIRIEDDHVAFYNEAGTAKRLYWDAENLVLGVNTSAPDANLALHVVGNTQTTDLVVTSETTSGNVVVTDELRGDTTLSITTNATFSGANTVVQNDLYVDQELTANVLIVNTQIQGVANLSIVSNTDFAESVTMANNLSVDGTLTINTLDYILVPDDYNNLIPNQTSGRLLGNTTNRWEGYFTDIDVSSDMTVSGNVNIDDTLTVQNLTVPGDGIVQLPSDVSFTGVTEFENITVTGTADFASANLDVGGLSANGVGFIGEEGSVSSTNATVIDTFPKVNSKGFKYIVHGENADSTSAYAIEINCSHNGTEVFYTRFGEVSNNFDAVLIPRISGGGSGANVELVATCSGASVSNTHNFNILRIETR